MNIRNYIPENFEKYFLHYYLNFGLKSMSKTNTGTLIKERYRTTKKTTNG